MTHFLPSNLRVLAFNRQLARICPVDQRLHAQCSKPWDYPPLRTISLRGECK
jgi:hypothetical protein